MQNYANVRLRNRSTSESLISSRKVINSTSFKTLKLDKMYMINLVLHWHKNLIKLLISYIYESHLIKI